MRKQVHNRESLFFFLDIRLPYMVLFLARDHKDHSPPCLPVPLKMDRYQKTYFSFVGLHIFTSFDLRKNHTDCVFTVALSCFAICYHLEKGCINCYSDFSTFNIWNSLCIRLLGPYAQKS